MNKNEEVWTIAKDAAFRVEFIINASELKMYTEAIYSAMMWGWSQRIKEKEVKSSDNDKLMK